MRVFLLLTCLLVGAHSYQILCIFPTPSRSHNTLGKGVVDALLNAGHEVTWATPFPPKGAAKNLNVIDVSDTLSIIEDVDMTRFPKSASVGLAIVRGYSRNISQIALNTPALKQAVIRNQYDAVVTEMFFSEIDSGYAAIQQVPWILLSGVVLQPTVEMLVDEVRSVPTIPLMFTDFKLPMNLWQRMATTFIYINMRISTWLYNLENEENYNAMFGPVAAAKGVPLPPFRDALHNISVLLVNSHPVLSPALSLPPNVVNIAGYHVENDPAPLPKDLQDLLDSSPQGVVYFSMGSIVKSAAFPVSTRTALIELFSKLRETVLWKFEEDLPGLPKNVHIRKWMPQDSILAHPNVKLFITHGGGLSGIEALHHGVPLISIPVFGDQASNALRAERAGYALKVPFSEDMVPDIEVALKKMLSDDSYSKRVKYLSKLFLKRPVAPSKLISQYVELAIESKGAYHLRSKTHLYAWYERWLLDALAVVLATLYIVYSVLKKLLKITFNKIKGTGNIDREFTKKKKVKKN